MKQRLLPFLPLSHPPPNSQSPETRRPVYHGKPPAPADDDHALYWGSSHRTVPRVRPGGRWFAAVGRAREPPPPPPREDALLVRWDDDGAELDGERDGLVGG